MNTKTIDKLKECIAILGELLDDEETKNDGMMCLKYFDSMIIAMENFGTEKPIPVRAPVEVVRGEDEHPPETHDDGCNCGMCEPGTGPLSQVGRAITAQRDNAGITSAADDEFKDKICDCGKSAMEKCDNSCRESEIKATGTVENYLKFLSGDEEDKEDLSEVVDSVNSFVDDQIRNSNGNGR